MTEPAALGVGPELSGVRLRRWLRRLEIDRAVAYGLVGRLWNVLSGPITVLLVAWCFTPEVQGYHYTFTSLLGLQVFVELGLTTAVVQFASHEWAHLKLSPVTGEIEGDPEAVSRLVSLGRIAIAWFGVAAALGAIGLAVGGSYFFSHAGAGNISWQAPWLTLCLLSAANLFVLPLSGLLEGCGQVSAVYGYRSAQAVACNLAAWTTMLLGGGLWTAPAFQAASLAAAALFLVGRYRRFFVPFMSPATGPRVSWRIDILPIQWRLAVSYFAGYFSFAVFTPLVFKYDGPIAAGQMGLTLTAVTMVGSVAALWSAAKAPRYGILIARRAYHELDQLFFRVAIRAEAVLFAGGVLGWITIYVLNVLGLRLADRFLSPGPAALLLAGSIAANFCSPMAVYLRAHKREPFMALSVILAALTAVSAWILVRPYGSLGVAVAYLTVSAIVGLPLGLVIFARCRRAWHADRPEVMS